MNTYLTLHNKQHGITMVEVLIAMLIMAVGLLGMASLQVRAVSDTANASFRSTGIFYANDMADRIRANPAGEQAGLYNTHTGGSEKTACLTVAGCDSSDMAAHDKWEWTTNLQAAMPGGVGTIAKNGDIYTVTVEWNARVQAEDDAGNDITTDTSSVSFSFEP